MLDTKPAMGNNIVSARNTVIVSSLLVASYEAYASYEYIFLTYFLGSVTWLSGFTYFKNDIQNNFNSKALGQMVLIS